MKKAKQFSRSYIYVYEKSTVKNIHKILGLFYAKHIFTEVIGIDRDSNFYKKLQRKKDEYGLISVEKSQIYSDVFISNCLIENVAEILNLINENCPEMLIFYFTNLPLKDFLGYDRKRNADKMIAQQAAVCVCTLMIDENVFSISFNSDLFCPPYYVSKIEEIFEGN